MSECIGPTIDPDINVDNESIRKKREIIIQSHGGALQNIPSDSPLYDPLSYTILFPYGDLGWTYTLTQNNKKISLLRYYSNRLHFRDKYGPIYYDYVLHAGLLSHQYIIDSWIKTEENRLHWLFHNQEKLSADFYQGTVNTNSQLTKLNNFCPEQNLINRCRRCITCGGQ